MFTRVKNRYPKGHKREPGNTERAREDLQTVQQRADGTISAMITDWK